MDHDLRPVQRWWGRPGGVAAPGRVRAAMVAGAVLSVATLTGSVSVASSPAQPVASVRLAPAAPTAVVSPAGPVGVDATVRDAGHPSVSGDGRWVVFEATVGERRSTFRTDRVTGTTVELTPVPEGVRAGESVRPVLSRDGCVVVVHTEMPLDLFRDDDLAERWDVYRLVVPECDGELGRWELVSTVDGSSRDDIVPDDPATLDGSGTTVAYTHPSDADAPSGGSTSDVSVVDLTVPAGGAGRVIDVPAMPAEAPTAAYHYRGLGEPALSADGRFLAFTADVTAADPLPGWAEGPEPGGPATTQVYLWDRDDPDRRSRIDLVSGRDGVPAAHGAGSPAVSVDGRVVVFVSADADLVDAVYPRCDAGCPTQVFRFEHDPDADRLDTGDETGDDTDGDETSDDGASELTLVSSMTGPTGVRQAGDDAAWAPAIDRGGDQVTFVTRATNLLPTRVPLGSGADDGDLLVAELGTGEIRRATAAADVGTVVAAHARPSVTDTGRVVVFETADPAVFGPAGALEGRGIVGVSATPTLSLADLDFGTVVTGLEGDELYVSVLNEGPGAFAPAVVTSTSSAFRVVPGGTCTRGLIVPAGDSCTVHMSFNPSRPLPFTGVLTVEEDDDGLRAAPDAPSTTVTADDPRADVPATGVLDADGPVADVPDSDAPRVDVAPSDPPPVDTPADPPADPLEPADDPADEPVVVTPAEIDSVAVAAVVTGAGGDPRLRVEPAGIDLAAATVGAVGERRALDVRNIGDVPTEVATLDLQGRSPTEFAITAESCTGRALNPGATCTVELEFRPDVASHRTATMVATTATGEYAAAIVSGVGRHDPEVHLATDEVVAGEVLGVGIAGFPADTDVTLSFDRSSRRLAVVRTDATGGLLVEVAIPRRTRPGERTLMATAQGGLVAATEVGIERRVTSPPVGVPGHGLG